MAGLLDFLLAAQHGRQVPVVGMPSGATPEEIAAAEEARQLAAARTARGVVSSRQAPARGTFSADPEPEPMTPGSFSTPAAPGMMAGLLSRIPSGATPEEIAAAEEARQLAAERAMRAAQPSGGRVPGPITKSLFAAGATPGILGGIMGHLAGKIANPAASFDERFSAAGADQPSPLDTAQWPSGPVGAPSGSLPPTAPSVGLLNSVPFARTPPGFDDLDTPATGDLTAEGARLAAAGRVANAVRRPGVFGRGTDAIPGIEAVANLLQTGGNGGEPPAAVASATPTPTNDPLSGEPQPADVPLPRPRPVNGIDPPEQVANAPLSMAPTAPADVPLPRPRPVNGIDPPEQVANAPLSMAPTAPDAALPPGATPTQGGGMPGTMGQPAGPGLFDRIFDPNKAATWLALGSGFAGAGSVGSGMRRAFGNAVPAMAADRAQMQKMGGVAETYKALVARGAPPQEALAATRNPELMKALVARYFETKAPINIDGRLVREQPDGTIKTIADFSKDKDAPKLGEGYRWIDPTDKSKGQVFIVGGPADPKVKALAQRQGEPPKYAWVDPDDHSKGQYAIPGGGAERVDANVAARLGLARSFLDQLPEIRRRIAAGEATGPWDALVAQTGYGAPGELKRQIQSGAEALLRNLTGAGMNLTEASKYVSRYELQPHNTAAVVLSKLDQLGRELIYTDEAVRKGRGGTIKIINGKILQDAPAGPAGTTSGKTSNGITFSVEP